MVTSNIQEHYHLADNISNNIDDVLCKDNHTSSGDQTVTNTKSYVIPIILTLLLFIFLMPNETDYLPKQNNKNEGKEYQDGNYLVNNILYNGYNPKKPILIENDDDDVISL